MALLALLLTLFGCDRPAKQDYDGKDGQARGELTRHEAQPELEPALDALPALDLSATDDEAREQLVSQRALAERLAADPDSDGLSRAEAFGQLARLYITYELLESAEIALINAQRLDRSDFRWKYLVGYVAALRGYPEESNRQLREALELRPDYLPALLRIGRNELELGNNSSASESFERALELDPETAAAHEGLGRIAAAAGDMQQAADHLERALEQDSQASAVHYALGQVYRELGDLDRARAHLEQSGDVLTRITDPLIQPLAELAANVQFYLVQGAEAIDNKDYEAAVAAYRAGLAQDAGSLAAANGLAVSLRWLGDDEGALESLRPLIESAPDSEEEEGQRAQVLALAGELALELGREDEAIVHYLASLALESDQLGLLIRTADALSRQLRFAEALELYQRVLNLEPLSAPMILERRAIALINLGRTEEAKAEFEEAIRKAPRSTRLRLRYAEALDFLGQPEAASMQRQELQSIASEQGDRARLAFEKARVEQSRGEFERAVTSYREAVELQPRFIEARWQLAKVLGHMGSFDEAVAELEKVIEETPRNADARRDQIVALVFGKRYGETRMKLQEALREFPRDRGFALTQVRLLASSPDERVRDASLALEIARRLELARDDADVAQVMALALARKGDFVEAIDRLVALLQASGEHDPPALAALWRDQLAAFERAEAWEAQSPEEILLALKNR